ncbi:MAG: hypothetical protein K2K02_00715 [Ruminococcus sp.]|nr:hypothetical protein [Ruminococcus sp.]
MPRYNFINRDEEGNSGRTHITKKLAVATTIAGAMPVTEMVSHILLMMYVISEQMGLYTDNLHTVLRAGVNQKTLDDLRERVNQSDSFGCKNVIHKSYLENEIATAEKNPQSRKF